MITRTASHRAFAKQGRSMSSTCSVSIVVLIYAGRRGDRRYVVRNFWRVCHDLWLKSSMGRSRGCRRQALGWMSVAVPLGPEEDKVRSVLELGRRHVGMDVDPHLHRRKAEKIQELYNRIVTPCRGN